MSAISAPAQTLSSASLTAAVPEAVPQRRFLSSLIAMLQILALLAAAFTAVRGLSAVRSRRLVGTSCPTFTGDSAQYGGVALIYIAVLLALYATQGLLSLWFARHLGLSLVGTTVALTVGCFTSEMLLQAEVATKVRMALAPAFGFLWLLLLSLVSSLIA